MTLALFELLTPRMQLLHLLTNSTLLASRQYDGRTIMLYCLTDEGQRHFAEVGYDTRSQETVVLRSFVSSEPLEDYA